MPRSQSPDKSRPQPEPLLAPAEREGVPFDQLPLEARLRFEHAEKWVAWAPDDQSIVASGETYQEVRDAAIIAGHPHAVMEWVLPITGAIWE